MGIGQLTESVVRVAPPSFFAFLAVRGIGRYLAGILPLRLRWTTAPVPLPFFAGASPPIERTSAIRATSSAAPESRRG